MPLTSGTKLAQYEILESIGEGGMGEVYKAQDLKLRRTVAIKVLQKDLASDPERLKRFEQEARSASALEHPNIVTMYDITEAEGVRFIVMQYVEGKTLRELLEEGRLKLSSVLDYAIQIADGLAKAHGRGIVHRDLKPDNIMVTEDGLIKIVDFGLAKLVEPSDPTEASTRDLDTPRTKEGHIVGTAPYMSPEQVEGKKLDARSDIFSFGSVLYEMVTGQRAFSGKSTPALLAAILHEEPKKISSVPPELERVLTRALRKKPERRVQSMADVKVELQEIQEGLDSRRSVPGAQRWLWVAAALAVAVVAALYLSRSELDFPPPRTIPITSYPGQELDPALSPDGNFVAFTREGETETSDLYVKMIDGGEPLLISRGSEDSLTPAWSHDGRRIAFIRHAKRDDGNIVDEVWVVSALGGAETRLASTESVGHGLSFSPDGKLLAFVDRESPEAPDSIYLLTLETGEKRKLTTPPSDNSFGDESPTFSPDGESLAFERSGGAMSDIYVVLVNGGGERRVTRNAATVGLDWTSDGASIVFSSSRPGRAGFWSLWRVSASGGEPEPLEVGEQGELPSLSRKGGRLAYVRRNVNWNIWRVSGPSAGPETRTPERFIASTGIDMGPEYSPDGTRILFDSNRSGYLEIWVCDSDGSNPRQLTFHEQAAPPRGKWSPDGQEIAFMSPKEGSLDIYVVGATGGIPRRLTTEDSAETRPRWSRDGRSIYFSSNRSGRNEIWKMAAEGGQAIQLTQNGGTESFETADGPFLYFGKQRFRGVGPPGIWRMPVSGGKEELVLESVRNGTWTATEKGIYFFDHEAEPGPTIDLFDFATAEVSRIAMLEDPPLDHWLTVSSDEKWILFVQDEDESDIMLVENFR